jgi:hypothetical protein
MRKLPPPPKLRLEAEPEALLRFLNENTAIHEVTLEDLGNDTLKIRIEDATGVVAYLWGSWIGQTTVYFHGCSARRLWLTEATFTRILDICRFFGIETLVCEPIGPTAPTIRRLLVHLGFDEDDGELYKDITEHGREEAQDPEDRPAAPAPVTAAAS